MVKVKVKVKVRVRFKVGVRANQRGRATQFFAKDP
jgi:hypothetical protein